MTLTTQQSLVQHQGNGVTLSFAVPFRVLSVTHLRVTQELAGVITNVTGFTGANLDQDSGGTITLQAAPPVGALLTIRRIVPSVQETDYVEGDPFPAETHERALDYLTMLIQQLEQQVSQQITVPDAGLNLVLPPAGVRAGKLFAWDGQGLPVASTIGTDNQAAIAAHSARTDNPHGVTAAQTGAYTKAEVDVRFVDVTGDTMLGALSVPDPTAGPHAVNKQTLDATLQGYHTQAEASARFVNVSGDTMTGALSVPAPTDGSHAVNLTTLDQAIGDFITQPQAAAAFVDISGDTMTGALFLPGAPTAPLQAATKAYADGLVAGLIKQTDADARYVNVTGDTITGALFCTANIDQDDHLATKAYVDGAVAAGGGGGSGGGMTQAQADARYINVTGDTMTGALFLPAAPTADLHAATKKYVDDKTAAGAGLTQAQADTLYVNVAGDAMQGPFTLAGDPVTDTHAATKRYVDGKVSGLLSETVADGRYLQQAAADGRYINTAGDTMTGALFLPAAPTDDLHAATKKYVDDKTAAGAGLTQAQADTLYVNVAGDTMQGPLTLGGAPITDLHAATKKYVDDRFGGAPAMPTATPGVGQVMLINPPAGQAYTIPAGGTWLVYHQQFGSPTGAFAFIHDIRIRPGGFVASAPAAAFAWVGWAWRIQ